MWFISQVTESQNTERRSKNVLQHFLKHLFYFYDQDYFLNYNDCLPIRIDHLKNINLPIFFRCNSL